MLPGIITGSGVAIGWMQEYSLFYIYLATVFLFAATATGLLRASEWRYRNSVADKLVFDGIRVTPILNEDNIETGISLGINVRNDALFPLSFRVDNVFSRFEGDYPKKIEQIQNSITLPPQGIGYFDDNVINYSKIDFGAYKGEIKLMLEYGKANKLDYELNIKQIVLISFNNDGKIFNWKSYEYMSNET